MVSALARSGGLLRGSDLTGGSKLEEEPFDHHSYWAFAVCPATCAVRVEVKDVG